MTFDEILSNIECLIGKQLNSVNPNTPPITLVKIDRENQNYYIKPHTGREVRRTFLELEKVWDQLSSTKTVNVEIALEGAGSSRHHPETIFANLPNIDHFKYQRKKHLYLQDINTHEIGTINALKPSQVRVVKGILDNQSNFDPTSFSSRLGSVYSVLNNSLSEIATKYPGELHASSITTAMSNLSELQKEIEATLLKNPSLTLEDFQLSTMDILESEDVTGFDDGDVDQDSDEDDWARESNQELAPTRIRHLGPVISLVFDRLKYQEIELQPDFQRRDRIWPPKNKSALIESILLGLPIPNLYFAERSNGNWIVVDGLQRLTTIKDFMEGKFKLTDLEFLDELDGLTFANLSRHYQRKFREYTLHSHIISMKTNDDVMVNALFQRINTYGARLSYQEIRCSLHSGSSVNFLRYIAESNAFTETTFEQISSKRMKDIEFVLGAVAFIIFGYQHYNYNKFDTFLTNAMKELNKFEFNFEGKFLTSQEDDSANPTYPIWNEEKTSDFYNQLRSKLEDAFSLAEKVFGENRYRKSGKIKPVLSKPLFELIISIFANLTSRQADILVKRKDIVIKEFNSLLNGTKQPKYNWESEIYREDGRNFLYSISQSTGKKVTILYRFQNFQALLEEIIDEPIHVKGMLENNVNKSYT